MRGKGYDTILGGYGNDTLLGGLDNDTLKGEYDYDKLNGGNGTDTCARGPHVNEDTATYCETITDTP